MKYPKTAKHWFDASAFAAPLPAWAGSTTQGFGTAGKDSVLGPGRFNFNTSVYKNFAIHENVKFQFRVESFNTFNHTQFNAVANSYAPGNNFGQITSTYDPRVLQLGGKLSF